MIRERPERSKQRHGVFRVCCVRESMRRANAPVHYALVSVFGLYDGNRIRQLRARHLSQLIQQRPGLFHSRCGKTFGETIVHRREQRARLHVPVLVLQKRGKAGRCSSSQYSACCALACRIDWWNRSSISAGSSAPRNASSSPLVLEISGIPSRQQNAAPRRFRPGPRRRGPRLPALRRGPCEKGDRRAGILIPAFR